MSGVNLNQNVNTMIQKASVPEKLPANPEQTTGQVVKKDEVEGQAQILQAHDADNASEAQQAKQDEAKAAKENFNKNKSQEEIKTVNQSLQTNVSKTLEKQEVKPQKVEKQSFEA